MKNKEKNLRQSKFLLLVASFLVIFDWFLQNYNRVRNFGTENSGVSFGLAGEIGSYLRYFLPLLVVILGLWIWKRRLQTNSYLLLMLIGGIGNAIPRLIWGFVWDYIWLPYVNLWINLSDVLISIAVLSYILGCNAYDRHTSRD